MPSVFPTQAIELKDGYGQPLCCTFCGEKPVFFHEMGILNIACGCEGASISADCLEEPGITVNDVKTFLFNMWLKQLSEKVSEQGPPIVGFANTGTSH